MIFSKKLENNLDQKTVKGFGNEWTVFDQSEVSKVELQNFFEKYFSLVDWSLITNESKAMDVGCGSGRWAELIGHRVGALHLVDPSIEALNVAREKLRGSENSFFHNVSTENLPGDDNSFDLIYSLGVLHHVPDTQSAITDCVKKLKHGAPFLVYLYYRFDNKGLWFRSIWYCSDLIRRMICRTPFFLKKRITDAIGIAIYWPLARLGRFLESRGKNVSSLPLSFYRHSSLYTMRTDALDRFGTRLEHRFTRREIEEMLQRAGLVDIRFRETEPYWCAIGFRS